MTIQKLFTWLHGIHWSSNGVLHKLWMLALFLTCLFYSSVRLLKILVTRTRFKTQRSWLLSKKNVSDWTPGDFRIPQLWVSLSHCLLSGDLKNSGSDKSLTSTSSAPFRGLEGLLQRSILAYCYKHSCFSGRLDYVSSDLYFYKNLLNVPNKCQNAVSVAVLFSSNPI